MFTKCTSLISLPDLSKWDASNLKGMNSLFIDCLFLISLPDISKWKYYDKNDINKTPDYNKINGYINLKSDFVILDDNQED